MVSIPERIRSVFRDDDSPGVAHEPDKAEVRSLLTDIHASAASELGYIDTPVVYGGAADADDSTAAITSMKTAMEAGGRHRAYLPDGVWNVTSIDGFGNILFEGPGELRGGYNRPTARQTVHAWSGSDIIPSIHLPRFSSAAAPVVVIFGDSIASMYQTNALSYHDQLEAFLRRAFFKQNINRPIAWYNRAIGGMVWANFVASPSGGLANTSAELTPWYTDPTKTVEEVIQALNPDLLICSNGMNESWNFNSTAFKSVMQRIRTWTKAPDILLCTNLTATSAAGSAWNTKVEQRGKDIAAGYVRTWAEANRVGLLDFHRSQAIHVHGFDPCVASSERVLQGANTLSGASISLSAYTQTYGRSQTLWEAGASHECRHYHLELITNSIPSDFWGDAPPDANPAWKTATVYAAGAKVQWMGRAYSTVAGGTSGATAPTHTSGSVSDGGVTWAYISGKAPIFARLSPQGASGVGTGDVQPVCGLLMWKDTGGNIFWNIRDQRNSPASGYADTLYFSSAQDSGVAAPTSGSFGIHVSIRGADLRVSLRPDLSKITDTVVIQTKIPRAGGAFLPAIGYDGDAAGRPTSFTLIFDKGVDQAVRPVLTADDVWGNSSTTATVGGNAGNHPSSRIAPIYQYVLENANLSSTGLMVDANNNVGAGTHAPRGRFHVKVNESGYSGTNSGIWSVLIEGLNSAGLGFLGSTACAQYIIFGDTADKEKAYIRYNHNTDRLDFFRDASQVSVRWLFDFQAGSYTSNADLTTAIPFDDTIPQSTEGTSVATAAHTAKKTTNRLCFEFNAQVVAAASGKQIIAALFDGVNADAIASTYIDAATSGVAYQIVLRHEQAAGTTSARTYSVRIGANDTTAVRLNGTTAARRLGGSSKALLTVQEYE